MICIACEEEFQELAESHVIPNSIRKRLTGETRSGGGTKYTFKWISRKDLPKQDLPKPHLMCKDCDNSLGGSVEKSAPSLLMPKNPNDSANWDRLPIGAHELNGIFDTPLVLGVYDYKGAEKEAIDKFALSIVWRALHALNKDKQKLSMDFLNSELGRKVERATYENIFKNQPLGEVRSPWLYYWPAQTAAMITGKSDEYPFAWAELGHKNQLLGVGVIFAHWVVLWPLYSRSPSDSDNRLILERICFLNWVGAIKADLSKNG